MHQEDRTETLSKAEARVRLASLLAEIAVQGPRPDGRPAPPDGAPPADDRAQPADLHVEDEA